MALMYRNPATGNEVPANGHDGSVRVFASAVEAGAVTASDSTPLDFNALWVGGTGNVTVRLLDGTTSVAFTNVPDGTMLPVAGDRVMAATTATSIVWLKW